jgi:FdhD protein
MEDPMAEIGVPVLHYENSKISERQDNVVVEEPLEMLIDDSPYYLTMRMPGEEIPLAVGFCFAEGVIRSPDDFLRIDYCFEEEGNRIKLYLDHSRLKDLPLKAKPKQFATYSSCGICGKEMVADIIQSLPKTRNVLRLELSRIRELQHAAQSKQETYRATGGTHSAAIFDDHGELLASSEDVGRHNALDKAIGKVVLARRVESAAIVILTSRISYEMVQKTVRLGAEILIGASAPTSLGINLANESGLTLVGFARNGSGNIYCHPERIIVR